MVAAKLFALKFGHQAVKTLVGCYGRSMDFTAFKLGHSKSTAELVAAFGSANFNNSSYSSVAVTALPNQN